MTTIATKGSGPTPLLIDRRYSDAVVEIVTIGYPVLPSEVQDALSLYMPVHGDSCLHIREHVTALHGFSAPLIELVEDLIAEDKIALFRSRGTFGNVVPSGLKMADRWPPNGYKEPHWVPVAFFPSTFWPKVD